MEIYGRPIDDNAAVARWLWGTLRLRALPGKFKRQGGRWVPSLDADHLDGLRDRHAHDPRVSGSLDLISAHRRATSLSSKLGGLLRHVGADGRVHTSLVDRQATGRISSSKPNLQQVAKAQEIARGPAVPASERPHRHAGIRAGGHGPGPGGHPRAGRCRSAVPADDPEHLAKLRKDRLAKLATLDPNFPSLYSMIKQCRNPQYRAEGSPSPLPFDPKQGSGLARAFQDSSADFYTVAATAMLGKPPKDKKERNFCKQTILGIVNGMGPKGLAKRLGCDERTARDYLEKFAATYPNEMAFRRLMVGQIALTGRVETFMGRDRTDTAHRWLVASPRVKILVSFKRSDRYWLDVSPLQPRGRVLTCYIHRAWDARPGRHQWRKIYDAAAGGILTNRDYRLYDQTFLEFNLPIRNFAWRSIRRVRWNGEEAKYRGLDATARSLFNAICQGGTADIAKIMMLGVGPLLVKFGARLVLQIHDELVFEVPRERVVEFIREAMCRPEPPAGSRLRRPDRAGAEARYSVRGSGVAGCPGDRVPASAPVRGGPAWSPPCPPWVACGVPIYKTRACPRTRGTPRPVLSEHRFTVLQYPKIYRAQGASSVAVKYPTHPHPAGNHRDPRRFPEVRPGRCPRPPIWPAGEHI